MRKWKKPQDEKPAQGLKILCFNKGDIYIAQRFKNYWFSIPFHDSKYRFYKEPELWQEIDFPNGLKGKIHMRVDNVFYNMDQLEVEYPELFDEFVEQQKIMFYVN